MLQEEKKDFCVRYTQLSKTKRALLEKRLRGELASSSEALTPSSYQKGRPMTAQIVSRRIAAIHAATPVLEFLTASPQALRQHKPGVANFLLGNPQQMPLPGFVDALQHWSVPQDKDWFAYKINGLEAKAAVATNLRKRRNVPFDPHDIF